MLVRSIFGFKHKIEEARFLLFFNTSSQAMTRAACVISAFILAYYIRFDLLTQGDDWKTTFSLRMLFGIFPLILILISTFHSSYKRNAQTILIIFGSIIVSTIVVLSLLIASGSTTELPVLVVPMDMAMGCIMAATAFGMMASTAVVVVAITEIICLSGLVLFFDLNQQVRESTISVLIGTFLISALISSQMELKARRTFRLLRKKASDNLKLQELAAEVGIAKLALEKQNEFLEYRVSKKTNELKLTRDATILSMATLAECRDNETGNHLKRTQNYVRLLASELQKLPEFEDEVTDQYIDLISKSAPLHDIGKVGIPDHILLKPGKLTDHEYETMKAHVGLGANAIEQAEVVLTKGVDRSKKKSFLHHAHDIAEYHHEKWDGTGYLKGLKGRKIPLSSRIMAIADVYDALVSNRVYKPAMSHDQAVEIILESKGTHFDPELTDCFERIAHKFQDVYERYSDSNEMLENTV